jgi:hypothetical protein
VSRRPLPVYKYRVARYLEVHTCRVLEFSASRRPASVYQHCVTCLAHICFWETSLGIGMIGDATTGVGLRASV